MFDIEKARKAGIDKKSIEIMERINENSKLRESCGKHDFKRNNTKIGKYCCKNCGCEESVEYVQGYLDGLKHAESKGGENDD